MAQGTRDLVAAARDAGVRRFVLMSALGVGEKTKELSPYYRAKWDMEQAVQGSGLEHVIFRPSFVFGSDGGVAPGLHPAGAVVAGHAGDRRRQEGDSSRSGSTTSPPTSRRASTSPRRRTGRSSSAARTSSPGTSSTRGSPTGCSKRRGRLNLPVGLVRAGAAMVEWLPNAPITRDQMPMIEAGDNICDMTPAHEAFGIETVPLDEQIRRAA